jgi:ATP-dependent Zn protease
MVIAFAGTLADDALSGIHTASKSDLQRIEQEADRAGEGSIESAKHKAIVLVSQYREHIETVARWLVQRDYLTRDDVRGIIESVTRKQDAKDGEANEAE